MTRPLVRLPTTVLGTGDLASLAGCAEALGQGRTVVVGAQRSADGHLLDEFVVAAALASLVPDVSLGVAARVGAGRSASVIAREATCAQLLGACDSLLFDGDHDGCEAAARVVSALFEPGTHSVAAGAERIVDAANLPQPSEVPAVHWVHEGHLVSLRDDAAAVVGDVVEVPAGAALPELERPVLYVLAHPVDAPSALAATLER